MHADDGRTAAIERNDGAPDGLRPASRDLRACDRACTERLRVEAIDARHQPTFPGIAYQPDALAIGARRRRRGEARCDERLDERNPRRIHEADADTAKGDPAPQVDLLEVRVELVCGEPRTPSDREIREVPRHTHEAALYVCSHVGLAGEPADALAARHRDDLHVLVRRVPVRQVDVVVARDETSGDALRLDPVAHRAHRLTRAKGSDDDEQDESDRDAGCPRPRPAPNAGARPFRRRWQRDALEIASEEIVKIRRHVTLPGACAAALGSASRRRCRAGHRAHLRSPAV